MLGRIKILSRIILPRIIGFSLVAAMQLQPWLGTRPYQRVFLFWKRIFSKSFMAGAINRLYPQYSKLLQHLDALEDRRPHRDEAEPRALFVLAHALRMGSRFPAVRQRIIKFFDAAPEAFVGVLPEGPAIVVMSHQYTTMIYAKTAFASSDSTVIGLKAKEESKNNAGGKSAAMTRDLIAAGRQLKRGGLVGILADGQKGSQPIWLPFCGAKFRFQAGFAALAVRQRVPAIFVHMHLTENGFPSVSYSEPVQPCDGDQASQMERYLKRYARHLERIYIEYPETIMPKHVKRFLCWQADGTEWVR